MNGPTLLGGVWFCADCGGAMTLRTSGKKGDYRYYTCCTRARQGETGCCGRTVPMGRLDDLVVEHIENRLLAGDRAAQILSGLLERRSADADRAGDRIARLKRQANDADARLTRLYEAIEDGVADRADENLKGRIAELKAIRDSARADVERAEAKGGEKPIEITPEMVRRFAAEAKRKLRTADGGFARHHVQKLAQRVEVSDSEVRIVGSKPRLFDALLAAGGVVLTRRREVRTFEPKWLPGTDSNHRPTG